MKNNKNEPAGIARLSGNASLYCFFHTVKKKQTPHNQKVRDDDLCNREVTTIPLRLCRLSREYSLGEAGNWSRKLATNQPAMVLVNHVGQ